ncbi:MAG TPA: hypothetical protein DDX84_08010 [Nitrospiraceae bacterium]|nr:hypothetical protein [Nitrospiraceae bacterium]
MYYYYVEQIVLFLIAFIGVLVFILLTVVGLRRIKRERYYKRLDHLRDTYRQILFPVLTNSIPIPEECFGKNVFSVEWYAIEDILFEAIEKKITSLPSITDVLKRLGYIDIYIMRLQKGNKFQRALAAEKLGKAGALNAVPFLINAIKDKEREVRTVAARALGIINEPTSVRLLTDLLIHCLDDPDYVPLRIVKSAIRKYKREAVQHLIPLLHHSSWRVRGQAADIIGDIGISMPVEVLITRLNDTEPDVRAKVSRALGKIRAKEAVEHLIGRLKDPSWVVRLQSARALGLIGVSDAVYPLLDLLLDTKWQVRSAAANSLRKMGSFVIPRLLRTLLQTRDRYAREQIVEELQKTDIFDKQVNRLGSRDKKEREEAIILLLAAGNNGCPGLLSKAVRSHTNPSVRIRLVQILSLINNPRSAKILQEVAGEDENEAVRYAARMILEKSKDVEIMGIGGDIF